MVDGWIKLSRDITKHWVFKNAEYFKWWFELIAMAAWRDHKVMHDTHLITLKRGQTISSVATLSRLWGRSAPTIIRFLKLLENEGMITREVLYRQTPIITICKYATYQVQVDTQVDTMLYTQVDTMLYRDRRKEKKDKKEKMLSNDNMQKAEAKFDAEDIRELFNREMLDKPIPKVRGKLKGQRLAFLTARVREYGIDAVREAITKAAQSDFLNGGGGRGFIASFEWIFRPNNFPKVLDGNFDNRQTTTSNGNQTDNQSAAQRVEAAANIVRRLFAEDDARASAGQGMPR